MAEFSGKPVKFEARASTEAIDRVWSLWTDVDTWAEWDKGLKSATLDGPMRLGANGTVVDNKGRASRFEITEIKPGKSFVFEIRLPGGRMVLTKEIAENQIRHQVKFLGLSRSLFAALVGRPNMDLIGPTVDAVVEMAESRTR